MLIGRESELSRVEKQFRQQKHALIVINSKPKMGRSTFLDEVRSLAVKQKWRVIPPISSDDQMTSADIIAINRNTTKNDFMQMVSSSLIAESETEYARSQPALLSFAPSSAVMGKRKEVGDIGVSIVSAQSGVLPLSGSQITARTSEEKTSARKEISRSASAITSAGTLLVISSYQPDEEFETWFLETYISDIKQETSPVVLIVAGYESDLVALHKKSDLRIELGEIPLQETTVYFQNLNKEIQTKMKKEEIKAYAEESAKAPVLINKLTRLLQLN